MYKVQQNEAKAYEKLSGNLDMDISIMINPYPHGRFLAPITHGLKVTFEGLSPAHFTPFPMLYNHYN